MENTGINLGDYAPSPFSVINNEDGVIEDKQEVVDGELETEELEEEEQQGEVQEEEQEEVEESWIDTLNKYTNLEVEGEWDDSIEGIAEYIKTATTKHQEQYNQLFWQDIQQRSPILYDLISLAYSPTGNVEEAIKQVYELYNEPQNYNVEVKDDETALRIIEQNYKDLDLPESRIKLLLEAEKEEGNLVEKAKKIQAEIQNEIKQEEEQYRKTWIAQKQQFEKTLNSNRDKIISTVQSGKLHNYIIAEEDKVRFLEWLNTRLVPLSNGNYAINKELTGDELESMLAAEFFNMNGADISKLIARKNETKRVGFIKQKLTNNNTKTESSKPTFDLGQIKFN